MSFFISELLSVIDTTYPELSCMAIDVGTIILTIMVVRRTYLYMGFSASL